jgi:hypothetical protein
MPDSAANAEPLMYADDGSAARSRDDLRRARTIAQLQERHRFMLVVSVVVIFLSLALDLRPTGQVAASWLPIESLPPMCGSRALLGIECPGCGLTRSFVALAGGDVRESIRLHRLGWLLAAAVVLQIPYRIYALCELRSRVVERRWPVWFGSFLIVALISNWLVKMIAVL